MRLFFLLFIFLVFIPFSSYGFEVVWGTRQFEKSNNIFCTPPEIKLRTTHEKEVNKFINVYREETLEKHLDKLFLCKELIVNGEFWYRGVHISKAPFIFVEVDSFNDLENVAHHEFSSIIYEKFFSEKDAQIWKRNTNLNYKQLDEITSNNVIDVDYDLCKDGALTLYSTSDLENDFNVISQYYLTSFMKHELETAASQHPKILAKRNIVSKIYRPLIK